MKYENIIFLNIFFFNKLCTLTWKFKQYVMDPKHTMVDYLRMILNLICDLKAIDNNLTNEQ